MKRLVPLLIAVIAILAIVAPGSASAYPTCSHPQRASRHGEVLPLEMSTFLADNEWYVVAENAPIGCYYILFETVRAPVEGETVWHMDAFRHGNGINPDVAPKEVICYRLAQTDDTELPAGEWRWSNEVCVEGFEGERTGSPEETVP